jgi:hypothetical protein
MKGYQHTIRVLSIYQLFFLALSIENLDEAEVCDTEQSSQIMTSSNLPLLKGTGLLTGRIFPLRQEKNRVAWDNFCARKQRNTPN